MYEVSKYESEKIRFVPARIEVIKTVRYKYGCRTCYQGFKTMPLPKMPMPKSYAHYSLLAHIITSKYSDHLPLHRQAQIWKRHGIEGILNKRTMIDWMNQCGKILEPIVNIMKDRIRKSGYARADESTIRVHNHNGQKKYSKGYVWLFMSGVKENPYVTFEYHPTRKAEVANNFFKGFKGTIIVDGYSGYNALRLDDNITIAGCNSHMRRKFAEIVKTTKKHGKAFEALKIIQNFYLIEKNAKNLSEYEKLAVRQNKAKPIWNKFKDWLNTNQATAPPKSPLGNAINYALNHYKYLTNYLDDGKVDICNNYGEQQIRHFTIGRKNWVSQSSSKGAESSAVLYSLAITCKAHGIDPFEYFNMALKEAPYCESDEDWARLVPGG